MNIEMLREVVQQTKEAMDRLLNVKGGEYANSDDRLANFKRGANLTGVTPLQVLFVYLSKHYDGVASFIRKSASGESLVLSEPIEGRLDDIIVYCTLAKALIAEARSIDEAFAPGDLHEHRSGVPGQRTFGEIRPTPVRVSSQPGDKCLDNSDVHRMEPGPGVHASKGVQPVVPPIVERRVTTKDADDVRCHGCLYFTASSKSFPCCNCYNAERMC